MNPFRPLLKLLDFVLGHDLQEQRAEKKAPVVRPRPPRSQAPQGDGFERGSRGPNVDLGGGRKTAPKLPDEPAGPPAVIEPSNFNASLDDLSHLVNEPMEPRPEFIPEGGMSTESLMREFSSLDAETQAAAVEQAAAKELEESSFDEVVDSFESAPALPPSPRGGEGRGEGQPAVEPAPASDFSHLVDAPLEAKPAFVPPGGMSTESLMDEFSSLDAETQAAAVAEAAAKEAAREAEEEELEEEPEPDPLAEPAPSGMSTESLMDEFDSLDSKTQAAEAAEEALAPHPDPLPAAQGEGATDAPQLHPATDAFARAEAAKRAAAEAAAAAQAAIGRAAAAQAAADEAVAQAAAQAAPKPEPTKPERLTPAWLVPATTAAPKKTVAAPAPGLSTESLMSEFESLDADTQQKAIDEAAARELVRQQQEEANRMKAEQAPLPASSQGEDD